MTTSWRHVTQELSVFVPTAAVFAIPIAVAATASASATAAATTTTATPSTAAFAWGTAPATAASAATTADATTNGAAIERDDVLSLRALLSLADLELHLLTFLELAEPAALDRGEVHEAIFSTIIRRDETVTLLCVEPLDYPCRAHRALSFSVAVNLRPLHCGLCDMAVLQLLLHSGLGPRAVI